MITFGSIPQRASDWTTFKPLITSKTLQLQYDQDPNIYLIYGYDGPEVVTCTIWVGLVPNGGDQAQNDADKADFETNHKPYANRSIDDVPSLIIATSIKSAGSANLAVNGSVTPVVFEYNPPSGYDIEISDLSFIFEDTTALAFGNRFITTALTTLANGLLLELKAYDTVVSPWQVMRRTRDVIEISDHFEVVTGTTNMLRVSVHLPHHLRLARTGTFGAADYLRVTVRDDLTSLDFAEAYVQGIKL